MATTPFTTFQIEYLGERSVGRCITETTYRVSATREIKSEVFKHLFDTGLVGFGQCHSVRLMGTALERWEPQSAYDANTKRWTYEVTATCDSSD